MEWLVILGVVGLASGACWYHAEPRQVRRALRRATSHCVAALPENTVGRVSGTVAVIGEPIKAPLSGRACVYYHVKVSKFDIDGRGRSRSLTESQGVAFVLADETGRAIVEPAYAKVAIVHDHEHSTDAFTPPTPEEAALLERHGRRAEGLLGIRSYVFEEGVIEPGERVAVLGAGVREPDPDAQPDSAYRGVQPTRLRLTSSAHYPLLISDDPATQEPGGR